MRYFLQHLSSRVELDNNRPEKMFKTYEMSL